MPKRSGSTKTTAIRTGKNQHTATAVYKKCPKCGDKTLRKGPRAASGKQRWVCRKSKVYCYSTVDPDAPHRDQNGSPKDTPKNPQFRRKLGGIKRFIITAAQNATPVHAQFLENLKLYAAVNAAELVIIPIRYKNPTSRWTASQEGAEHWDVDDELLYNQRKKLCDNLVLLADIKTVPTADKPLTGFEAITHQESGILGHTKLQLTTVPVPSGRTPKILTTTGACTVANYTDSKAGKKGEFHHTLGACVVEIVGKRFYMRQVNATADGNFIDLDKEYVSGVVGPAPPALALVFGDTHREFICKDVEKATYGKGGMVERLDPTYLVFHDLHDGYSRNPHHRSDPFTELAKRSNGQHLVAREVAADVEWLERVCEGRQGVVVSSNHDNFFTRWIMDTDWKRDPDNAIFYLETALAMVRSVHMTESGSSRIDPFIYWVDKLKSEGAPIRCLGRTESFMLGGVELSMHGDQGPNGVRGSRQNLKRIGVKSIIGHSHSPGIEEGCYQAGTSTPLRLEYNTGPSSWMQCHVVLYANGKRSLLPIIDGGWCFD